MATAKTFKPAAGPRPCPNYRPDPEQGRDWHGWQRCLTCRRWGDPADPRDPRHQPPPTQATPPHQRLSGHRLAAATELNARIMGEGRDD